MLFYDFWRLEIKNMSHIDHFRDTFMVFLVFFFKFKTSVSIHCNFMEKSNQHILQNILSTEEILTGFEWHGG